MTSKECISPAGQRVRERISISVIVPTRNEEDNVQELAGRLFESMVSVGETWELVFVDDSDDQTPDRIQSLCRKSSVVRLVHRPSGQRHGGLAGAVVEGFAVAEGSTIVVMDGDLQHPPEVVPLLASPVLSGACQIAVGSRYVDAARSTGLAGPYRRAVSQVSRIVVRNLFPAISRVKDPLSGFFALSRDVIVDTSLAPEGFKILLEVLVNGHWDQVQEIPYEFAARQSGGSKAGWNEGTQFVQQMLRLRLFQSDVKRPAASAVSHTEVVEPTHRRTTDSGARLALVADAGPTAGARIR
jgi:dolichol-phosphate mannosyltransferase